MIFETYIEEIFRRSEARSSDLTEHLENGKSANPANVVTPS